MDFGYCPPTTKSVLRKLIDMKILHYTHNLGSGGAEKLLSDILPLMKEKGHEVHLAISNDKKNVPKFQEILNASDIPIFNFDTSFYNPIQIIRIARMLRAEKYDIVHAHLFPTQYWLAFASVFKLKGTRLCKTEHNESNSRRKFKILRPIDRWIYSRYDNLIGITSTVTENLAIWLKNRYIETIPNGVNLQQIQEAQQNYDAKNYDFLKPNTYNILMVGRFDGINKDQLSLIKALEYLPDDVQLYFAGEGPAQEAIKEKTSELGFNNRVNFLGLRTDIYTIMNLVDLNVLSTNMEGLSGVTLESLASGKPFIGTDVGGVNNIVPDKSFLFPKQNPQALAEKITEIKDDRSIQEELVKKALDHVKAYDISHMVEKYLEVYQKA